MKNIVLNNCYAKVSGFNKNICILITEKDSYLIKTSDYNNDRTFSGVPLYHSEDRNLFFLLESGYLLSDIVSGVVDWDCRKDWLNCFSEEQIKEALTVENTFSGIVKKNNPITTYIIESPSGETHKLEIVRTENRYRVFVDGWVDDTVLTEEELLRELDNPTF